jgi:hypothetical protein
MTAVRGEGGDLPDGPDPGEGAAEAPTKKPPPPPSRPLFCSSDSPKQDGRCNPQAVSGADDAAGRHLALHLNRLADAENLIILAGSGTSLSLNTRQSRYAPSMYDLWDACRSSDPARFDAILSTVDYSSLQQHRDELDEPAADIELLLSLCESRLISAPSDATLSSFVTDAKAIILARTSFANSVPADRWGDHERLLRSLGRRGEKQQRLKIFTTNYDLAFEVASSRTGFIPIDGFDFSDPAAFNPMWFSYDIVTRSEGGRPATYIPNVYHLYKLHGSVNWRIGTGGLKKTGDLSYGRPVFIYPSRGKYQASYEPPYLDMVSSFLAELRKQNTAILCVGFGFNDNHLNNAILLALRTNPSLSLFVATLDLFKQNGSFNGDVRQLLEHAIAAGDSRVGLFGGSFTDLVSRLPNRREESPEDALAKFFATSGMGVSGGGE